MLHFTGFLGYLFISHVLHYFNVWVCISGSLQISTSQESDEGKYECVAENSAGVAYSYGANLYVRGEYTFDLSP